MLSIALPSLDQVFLPVIVGTLIALLSSSSLFLVKKALEIANQTAEIANHQTEIKAAQKEFRTQIQTIMSKQITGNNDVVKLSTDLLNHMKGEERVVTDILGAIDVLGHRLDAQSLSVAMTAYRQAGFHSPDAFYITLVVDGSWEFNWGNASYYGLSGLTMAEAKADAFWDKNILPTEVGLLRRVIVDQTDRGEDIDMQHNFICGDGTIKFVHLSAIPVLDSNGKPVAYFGVIKVLGDAVGTPQLKEVLNG